MEIREEDIDVMVQMKEQEAKNFLIKCGYSIMSKEEAAKLKKDQRTETICVLVAAFCTCIAFYIFIRG